MKKLNIIFTTMFLFCAMVSFAQPGDMPISQEPGKCYAKCLIADEYETVSEQVQVRAASSRTEVIPAEYSTATEQVMTKAASSRIERVPAKYETATSEYVVGCPDGYHVDPSCSGGAPGSSGAAGAAGCDCIKEAAIPATYETQTEQVLKKAASSRIEVVPATYETVTEQVMTKAASSRIEVIPATYKTVTEQVMVKPVTYRTSTVPAEYERQTEQYVTKEASTRIERVPAKYETQTETIETSPASTKWVKKKADRNCLSADPNDCLVWCLVEVPAQYRTITKKVRVGCADGYTDSGDDCTRTIEIPAEYGTRTFNTVKTAASTRQVEVPAEYKTITKKVIDTPASTRTVEIPAQYSTITKKVVKTPATTRTVEIPAEYTTRSFKVVKNAASTRVDRKPMITRTYTTTNRAGCPDGYTADTGASAAGGGAGSTGTGDCIRVVEIPAEYGTTTRRVVKNPASTRTIEVPAEYATVTRRNLTKKGGFTEWREVLCGDKVTGYTIRQIQSALSAKGYDAGPADNILGARTKAALTKFQKDNNLPVGQLDMETLKALGVNY